MTRQRRRGARRELRVNSDRCRRYGMCEAEAPELFQLLANGRLRYRQVVSEEQIEQARAAVRCCPMLAIVLKEGQ